MDPKIVEAILSDEMLKTAEDAEAAGRIAARAYADEWQRLEGLFKGAQADDADDEGEDEDEDDKAEEESEAEEGAKTEKKGEAEEEGDEGDSPVSPEDLAWLVENMGV